MRTLGPPLIMGSSKLGTFYTVRSCTNTMGPRRFRSMVHFGLEVHATYLISGLNLLFFFGFFSNWNEKNEGIVTLELLDGNWNVKLKPTGHDQLHQVVFFCHPFDKGLFGFMESKGSRWKWNDWIWERNRKLWYPLAGHVIFTMRKEKRLGHCFQIIYFT